MNEWSGKRVLVTGAGGFIGSHLTEALARAGATVRAFVRYNSRGDAGLLRQLPADVLSELDIVAGDLRDGAAVARAVAGCEVVFHLGAIISIPYSYQHPLETAETNFMGTLAVLLACREQGVGRLVHTSTSEVYGTAQFTPMDESHPLQGQSPYSASKIGADKLVESFYRSYDLPAVTVRPFNTYGPRQSARAVIPTIITQALTSDCIQLGSLTTRRDFTYVGDTVSGDSSNIVVARFTANGNADGVHCAALLRRMGNLCRNILSGKVAPAEDHDPAAFFIPEAIHFVFLRQQFQTGRPECGK